MWRELAVRKKKRDMAVDYIPYPERHDLARAEKAFYPTKIPISHWQLRHYISNPENDLLYYASGHDVYCLDPLNQKRKLVVTLPFDARCMAAGYGWLCVGGEEEGHFATVKLDGVRPSLGVDSALPLDHWQTSNRRAPLVHVERIGLEIVNSVSIHRVRDEEAHLDDIVAVLTNNDKTVRVYSLPLGLETQVKDLPCSMNHASISPDGLTMIAVGDENQAYFFSRDIVGTPPQIPRPHNRMYSSSVNWNFTSVVTLHASNPEVTQAYFTTAWSPSGQLVAVGSEDGHISVFDMELLADPEVEDEEAIIAVVPGSRADLSASHPGAIRTMVFSPGPWDLLIWAEDQGRVCIGDLRTGLRSRQVITLDPKAEDLQPLEFEDLPADEFPPAVESLEEMEADMLRRIRAATDSASQVNFASEYIEARRRNRMQHRLEASGSAARERQQQQQAEAAAARRLDRVQGLSEQEQTILDTLRSARQREEARSGNGTSRSTNYTTSDLFTSGTTAGLSSSSTPAETAGFPELARTNALVDRSSSSRPRTFRSSNGLPEPIPIPSATSFTPPPDRQHSLPASNSTTEADEPNPWTAADGAAPLSPGATSYGRGPLYEFDGRNYPTTATVANGVTSWTNREPAFGPPTVTASSASAEDSAEAQRRLYQTVRNARAYVRRLGATPPTASSVAAAGTDSLRLAGLPATTAVSAMNVTSTTAAAATARELRRDLDAEMTYEHLLQRRNHMRSGYAPYQGREIGVRTAGLAMRGDGRVVWVACEEGIFEVGLEVKGRLGWVAEGVR